MISRVENEKRFYSIGAAHEIFVRIAYVLSHSLKRYAKLPNGVRGQMTLYYSGSEGSHETAQMHSLA